MATKITFEIWAGLLSGRIAQVNEGSRVGFLSKVGEMFVMSKYNGCADEHHSLLVDATDHERLDAHWQGFTATTRHQ